VTAFTLNVL